MIQADNYSLYKRMLSGFDRLAIYLHCLPSKKFPNRFGTQGSFNIFPICWFGSVIVPSGPEIYEICWIYLLLENIVIHLSSPLS